MKDSLNQKGWKDMSILLDKEMPIAKKSNRKAVIFFLLSSLILMVSLFWLINSYEISKSESEQLINIKTTKSNLIANSTEQESETRPFNSHKSSLINETSENKTTTLKESFYTKNSNLSSTDLTNSNLVETSNLSNSKVEGFEMNNSNIEFYNSIDIDLSQANPLESITNRMLEVTPLLKFKLSSIKSIETSALSAKNFNTQLLISSYESMEEINPKLYSKTNFGVELSLIKNITKSGKLGSSIGFSGKRVLNKKYNLRFSTGLMIQNVDYSLSLDTATNEIKTLDNFGDLKSSSIIFNPYRIWQWHSSVGIEKNISKRMYLTFDLRIPYIIKLNQENDAIHTSSNILSTPLNYINDRIKNYNKWDIQPSIGIGWKLNKNLSLEAKYVHGLRALVEIPNFAKSENYFTRSFEVSTRYFW